LADRDLHLDGLVATSVAQLRQHLQESARGSE
jgi:hypothetical protein